MTDRAVKIIKMDDDRATVGGYGVVFGGVDLEGETFSADTNYMLDLVPTKLALYDHGQQKNVDTPIGMIPNANIEEDEKGLFVKAELDRSAEYVNQVLDLIGEGVLGWSSGTVGHLARRDEGKITQWPIVEFSLTPTPAEPRTLGVERIKSLAKVYPDLEALLPEAAKDTATKGATEQGEQATLSDSSTKEGADMSDENDKVDAVTHEEIDDLKSDVKSMSEDVAKILKWADEQPATNDGGTAVKVIKDEGDQEFETFGKFLKAVQGAGTPGGYKDPKLAGKATGLNETVGADGGFLVQVDQAGVLAKQAYDRSILASRVRRTPVGPNSNGLTAWAVNETARATGSRWGGIQSYWLDEGGTKTASKPAFREINLKLRKLIGLCYATDELLADAVALESIISEGFADDFAWMLDDAIFRGAGGFQPLGFLNSGAIVSVTKETGQAADTVVSENIHKMYSRRLGNANNYVWLVNQDLEPQLFELALSVGTGGMPLYAPPGGISAAPYGSLMGRPVLASEHADTVGDEGDIAFVDLSQYIMIDKGGTEAASSIHVNFVYDETAFRFVYRVDGQPIDAAPVTPAYSALTQSPFVVLAARA